MSKPKFAMYWASACGGCEIAVLDIDDSTGKAKSITRVQRKFINT